MSESNGRTAGAGDMVVAEEPLDGSWSDLSANAVEFDEGAEPGDGTFDLAD
jgi:hypothetical protein